MSNIKYRIHKRPFNPSTPEAKNVRVLVAQFTKSGETEAKFLFANLQAASTSFNDNDFSKSRYTFSEEAEPVKSRFADMSIDADGATPTNRPVKYTLSWHAQGGKCKIMAYTKLHGTVRAIVEDEPEARNQFVRKLKQVWPNAEQARK